MAKSRRRRTRETENYKIITLGSSIICIVLNLIVVYSYYFHPFKELLNLTLIWCTIIPSVGLVGVLIYLTYVIHKGRQSTMNRVFVALCAVLFLEIFIAFASTVAYVVVIDHKLIVLKTEVQPLFKLKIEKKFKCIFVELKNSTSASLTEERKCIPILRMHTRTIAVYMATIYMLKFVLLGSEALMILFYYMNFLPT